MAKLWYVRRGRTVKGPFPEPLVRRFLGIGRIRDDDELSINGDDWETASKLCETVFAMTEKVQGNELSESLRQDERGAGERRQKEGSAADGAERRSSGERRGFEPEPIVLHRQRRARMATEFKPPPRNRKLQYTLLAGMMAVILVSGIILTPESSESPPDCAAKPRAGVNWSNCRFEALQLPQADLAGSVLRNVRMRNAELTEVQLNAADLAYAELAYANLSKANLQKAQLKGANLQHATLTGTNFRGADLSYADLSGANMIGADLAEATLNQAIWIDGLPCGIDSVGGCRR